jgi:chemotaxis protein MotB
MKQLSKEVEAMLESIKTDPDMKALTEHISVKTVNEGTLIELVDGGDNFMFPVGSTGLKPDAVKFLQRLAPILARLRNKVEVHGHTDARPFESGKKTNWDLSFDRANEARRVLEAAGVPSSKINGVLAHADSSPFNKEDPYAPENRRLALLVLREPRKKKEAAQPQAGAAPAAAPTDDVHEKNDKKEH